jgi:hypothetical protein
MKRCSPATVFDSTGAVASKSLSRWLAPEWTFIIAFLWFAYMLSHADWRVDYVLLVARFSAMGFGCCFAGFLSANQAPFDVISASRWALALGALRLAGAWPIWRRVGHVLYAIVHHFPKRSLFSGRVFRRGVFK